jgi:hypothetical protein
MKQNLNKPSVLLSWPVEATFAMLRETAGFWVKLSTEMSKDIHSKDSMRKAGHKSAPVFASDDELADAIRTYQKLHLDDAPHAPEVLKIIRTPLGFRPD